LLNLTSTLSLRQQYFLFLGVGNIFPLLALTAIALGKDKHLIIPLINRYLNPEDPIAHPKAIITGNDLIEKFNLSPSPQIGKLLTEAQIAYIEDKVATKAEALNFVHSLIINS
jgi:tRNA nucleotidyltransferase (CCA-adding enzyme)